MESTTSPWYGLHLVMTTSALYGSTSLGAPSFWLFLQITSRWHFHVKQLKLYLSAAEAKCFKLVQPKNTPYQAQFSSGFHPIFHPTLMVTNASPARSPWKTPWKNHQNPKPTSAIQKKETLPGMCFGSWLPVLGKCARSPNLQFDFVGFLRDLDWVNDMESRWGVRHEIIGI